MTIDRDQLRAEALMDISHDGTDAWAGISATTLLALLDQADAAEARIKAVEDVLAAWHVEPGESGLADDLLRALNT